MVVSCCAYGCRNRHGEKPGLGFFRFPTQPNERRKRWMQAVRRRDWQPSKHARICGDHFVSGESIVGTVARKYLRQSYFLLGKPVDQSENVDYVPSVFSYNQQQHRSSAQRERRNRIDRRRMLLEVAAVDKENERQAEVREKESQEAAAEGLLLLQRPCKVDAQTQSSPPVQDAEALQSSLCPSTPTVLYLPVESGATQTYGRKLLEGNDECTRFYTGLKSCSIFNHLVTFLCTTCPTLTSVQSKLSPFDGLLLTLMRLRLNLRMEDIAYRFDIGSSTASVFSRYIDLMYFHLKFLIKWPSQEVCRANMPQVFKDLYPRTRCIIDCSEIFIERPCSYQARAQTYSNYKKHNTVKFLIGITPCGAISYISKCWGGRATDKCITMNSDFLRLLEYGDIVLADRGFDIADDIAVHGATLIIPSFTRGKKQLSLQEVECSKKIAKVRIHVERVIGLLKNKYTILQGTLPVTFLKRKHDTDTAFIDKVLVVCSALVNLAPSVVTQ